MIDHETTTTLNTLIEAGLEDCPFCNSQRGEVRRISAQPHDRFVVICHMCGARGPSGATANIAIHCWNMRPQDNEE